jgi:hypothetical protein
MMRRRNALVVTALGVGVFALAALQAQQRKTNASPKVMTLTAMDYIQIQQLVSRYPRALDTCSSNGYDYADLYTSDGYFGAFRDGRMIAKFQGRDRLALAAGGGTANCKKLERPGGLWMHALVNHVIEPSSEGATGAVDLVYPLEQGAGFDPDHSGHVGHYEDVYVKTAAGWRFKSRIHSMPPPRVASSQTGPQPSPSGLAR